jgi:hypothetical protein
MSSFKWLQTKKGKIILSISILSLLGVGLLFKPILFFVFFEYVVLGFNEADFLSLASLVSNFTLVLLGIIVPVFVFTVTLIGNAARLAKEQQASTEQENKKGFDKDIENLNKKLVNIHPEDLTELKEQINKLEIKKRYTEDKIKKIEIRYASLELRNSVVLPSVYLMISLVFNKWLIMFYDHHLWQFALLVIGIFFLCYAIKIIIFVLEVVQEVSLIAESRKSEELRNSLIDALKTVEKEKEPKPYLKFKEKPPFIFKPNTESNIEFEVDLKLPGNKEAKNVDVWILMSPEIEILPDPSYKESFKQPASWPIPNANTTICMFGLVRKYTRTSGKIKIKTTTTGKYKLRYSVECDNHVESADADKEIDILVQD